VRVRQGSRWGRRERACKRECEHGSAREYVRGWAVRRGVAALSPSIPHGAQRRRRRPTTAPLTEPVGGSAHAGASNGAKAEARAEALTGAGSLQARVEAKAQARGQSKA